MGGCGKSSLPLAKVPSWLSGSGHPPEKIWKVPAKAVKQVVELTKNFHVPVKPFALKSGPGIPKKLALMKGRIVSDLVFGQGEGSFLFGDKIDSHTLWKTLVRIINDMEFCLNWMDSGLKSSSACGLLGHVPEHSHDSLFVSHIDAFESKGPVTCVRRCSHEEKGKAKVSLGQPVKGTGSRSGSNLKKLTGLSVASKSIGGSITLSRLVVSPSKRQGLTLKKSQAVGTFIGKGPIGDPEASTWAGIVEKIKRRLDSWKWMYLSKAHEIEL